MEPETFIGFTGKELDEVLEYMERNDCETLQEAILKAIREGKHNEI